MPSKRHSRWPPSVCLRPLLTQNAPFRRTLPLPGFDLRSEEHTSELQSQSNLVCRLLLEKKKIKRFYVTPTRQLLVTYSFTAPPEPLLHLARPVRLMIVLRTSSALTVIATIRSHAIEA